MTTQIAKIHKTLFCLLILFLPTQLGKHFWPDWIRVLGLRLDYLSPTIYLTDILILGILISWIVENFSINSLILNLKKYKWWLLFFVYLFFSCFLSQNQPVAFYKLIKIIEFLLLGFYIAKNRFILNTLYLILPVPIVYSSLLAIAQFINQRSLGGTFYWFGERSFNTGTPGIAQTIWNGRLLLRPYATFSHPNVLAGFLVIGLLILINTKYSSNVVRSSKTLVLASARTIYLMVFILGTIVLFLTFSHVAWVVLGLSLIVYFFVIPSEVEGSRPQPRFARFLHSPAFGGVGRNDTETRKKKIFIVFVFLLSAFYFLLSVFPIQSESITYRQDLNLAAIKMWQSSSLVGVGLNNFLVRLPEFYQSHGEIRWFQPAHNIFLLMMSETGLVGLAMFLWFLVLTYKRLLNCSIAKLLIPLTAILVLGFFDHYFYTLQQGQILLTIILGLAWTRLPRPSGSQ